MKTINENLKVNEMSIFHKIPTITGINKMLLMACMLPMFAGCNYMDRMANLTEDNLKLHKELEEKKVTVDYFTKSYVDIENNLINIKTKQNLISVDMNNETGLKPNIKERIKDDIKQIDLLMTENKKAIADLEVKLAKSDSKTAEMDRMTKTLHMRIDDKQREYNELRAELVAANIKIQDYKDKVYNMDIINESQANIIGYQQAKINTAYYVIGTYKELKKDGILTKKGRATA
jgi:chromosome segregation ATPase